MSFIRKIDYLKIILCNSGFGMYLNKIIKINRIKYYIQISPKLN